MLKSLPVLLHQALDNDIDVALKELEPLDPRIDALISLKASLTKKLVSERAPNARQVAIDKFLECNEKCKRVFSPFNTDDTDVELVVGQAQKFISDIWSSFNRCTWYTPTPRGRFGPGKTQMAKDESLAAKLNCEMTTTSSVAFAFYEAATKLCPHTALHELHRGRKYGTRFVTASDLTTVEKDNTQDRVICIEPSCNMFLQQAIREDLTDLLRIKCGIDLSNQPEIQRKLARKGSIDGSLATIDLSSASDTISMSFCEWLLPADLFSWLYESRSPSTSVDGKQVELNMISSMGNSTTFPLQTLIFFSICYGAYQVMGIKPNTKRSRGIQNLGVFGDDIIVTSAAYDLVCRALVFCGFTPNPTKSFATGPFRESCGGDFHYGYPVRGVYIKDLSSRNDLFSAYNRINEWATYHKLKLQSLLRCIASQVRRPLMVPLWEADTAGFRTPYGYGDYIASVPRTSKVSVPDDSGTTNVVLFFAGCLDNTLSAETLKKFESRLGKGLQRALPKQLWYSKRSKRVVYHNRTRKGFGWDNPTKSLKKFTDLEGNLCYRPLLSELTPHSSEWYHASLSGL